MYSDLTNTFSKLKFVRDISNAIMLKFAEDWWQSVNQLQGRNGRDGNKLRRICHREIL